MKPEEMTAEQAIESALAVAHLEMQPGNYYKAINDLINWHITVELDPAVSRTPSKIIREFLDKHMYVELYQYDTATIDGLHSALSEAMIGK